MASSWGGADPYAYGRGAVHPNRWDKSGIETETRGTDWEENHIVKSRTKTPAKPWKYWDLEAFCAIINTWKMLRTGPK